MFHQRKLNNHLSRYCIEYMFAHPGNIHYNILNRLHYLKGMPNNLDHRRAMECIDRYLSQFNIQSNISSRLKHFNITSNSEFQMSTIHSYHQGHSELQYSLGTLLCQKSTIHNQDWCSSDTIEKHCSK